jgi:hypothetical protein
LFTYIFDGDLKAMKMDPTVWLIHPHLMKSQKIVCRLIFAEHLHYPLLHDPDRCLYSPPSNVKMNLIWA